MCSKHIYYMGIYTVLFKGKVKKMPNKLFKRDSQRVAFLLCVGLSD